MRTFAWANIAVLAFSIGFAANLLANILWMQNVWGYSSLRTGLGVAPGPIMVIVFGVIAQSVSQRISVGRIAAIGCGLCALGALTVLLSVGPTPAYLTQLLPGWLMAGAGIGLALPTPCSPLPRVDCPHPARLPEAPLSPWVGRWAVCSA